MFRTLPIRGREWVGQTLHHSGVKKSQRPVKNLRVRFYLSIFRHVRVSLVPPRSHSRSVREIIWEREYQRNNSSRFAPYPTATETVKLSEDFDSTLGQDVGGRIWIGV